jgi:WD40 repeat protein
MEKKYKITKTLASVFAFFLIFTLVIGYGFAEDKTEVKKEGWKEIRIDEAYLFNWCGNRHLILEGGGKNNRLIDIYTQEVQQLPVTAYYGCSPDGRYVFSQGGIYMGKKCEGLAVYDTKTKQVQCLLNTKDIPSFSKITSSFLSPDGKYLVWNSKGKIKLHGGEILTLIPVLDDKKDIMQSGFKDIAWSPDSKKVFILTGGEPQRLLIYDVSTNKLTLFKLELTNNFYGINIKPSSDGKKLYIRAMLYEESGRSLYVLNLTKLDLTRSIASPKLIMKDFWDFDIGSDDLIVFHKFPDPEAHFDPSDIKNAGLYLADSKGKIIQRLTSNTIDLYPKYSKDGQAIAFRRATVKFSNKAPSKGEGVFGLGIPDSVDSVYILLRKN